MRRSYTVCAATILASALAQASYAGVDQGLKALVGFATSEVEESRPRAYAKTFNYDFNACYSMVEGIFSKMPKTTIYAKSEYMIAVYYTDPNTTPVGVYIVQAGSGRTQVQVSSPSSSAKEWVAKNLFNEKVLPKQAKSQFMDEPKREVW